MIPVQFGSNKKIFLCPKRNEQFIGVSIYYYQQILYERFQDTAKIPSIDEKQFPIYVSVKF